MKDLEKGKPILNSQSKTMHQRSVAKSCRTLCDPMDYSPQAPLSMEFPRQEYWSGLPYSPPGDLPDPGVEPLTLVSPAEFFTTRTPWEAPNYGAV